MEHISKPSCIPHFLNSTIWFVICFCTIVYSKPNFVIFYKRKYYWCVKI